MNKLNVVGVDLAKNVIQVSVLSRSNRELQNRALTRRTFAEFLGSHRRSLVAFEACAIARHWARVAQRYGHEVKIIPAKAVTPYRQGGALDGAGLAFGHGVFAGDDLPQQLHGFVAGLFNGQVAVTAEGDALDLPVDALFGDERSGARTRLIIRSS